MKKEKQSKQEKAEERKANSALNDLIKRAKEKDAFVEEEITKPIHPMPTIHSEIDDSEG